VLSLFRKNIFANYLFLLVYALLLQSLSGFSLLGAMVVFTQALFVNYLSSKNKLESSNTLYPGMVYVLLCHLYPGLSEISQPLVANFFVIAGLLNTMDCYQGRNLETKCFNAGFFITLACLVQPSLVPLLLFPIVAIFTYRKTSFREILQILIGHITPLILYYAYHWLRFDTYPGDLFPWRVSPAEQISPWIQKTSLIAMVCLAFFSTFLLKSFLLTHTSIHARNKTQSLYYLSFFGLLSVLLYGLSPLSHALVLWIPLSLLFSHFFSYLRPLFAEILHLFLLLLVVFFHYFST
jgi:hypothetical protein